MSNNIEGNKKDYSKNIRNVKNDRGTPNNISRDLGDLKYQDDETKRKIEDCKIVDMIREETKHLIFDKSISEEKKENKSEKIDQDKNNFDENKENKWDNIDWNKNNEEKKERDTQNNISRDLGDLKYQDDETKRKIEDCKIVDMIREETKHLIFDKSISEEKKENKSEKIDQDKNNFDENKENKWEKIDWNKNSEEKKENIWDRIDWNKEESDERNEVKIESNSTDSKKNDLASEKEIEEKNEENLKIKEEIKNINWDNISNDWTITHQKNQYADSEIIHLDPYKDCSKENPLYRNKDWLERIYNDERLNLSDKKIGEICGVNGSTIGKWRKTHDIPSIPKGVGKWVDNRDGRVKVLMPKDYNHPELKISRNDGRVIRPEHLIIMEHHLSKNPNSNISKKYLLEGKYLRTGVEVHHVNFNPKDNRIENLWLYDNKKEHSKGELTMRESLKSLIKSNQIGFKDGQYFIKNDYSNMRNNPIHNPTTQYLIEPLNFKDINLIKNEIKKIDWKEISQDWGVKIRLNQFSEKTITVDPFKDCSEKNPLYRHKEWVQHLVNENKFNLTDSRLGDLCGISRDKARYWRDKIHHIDGKIEWGYNRIVDKSDGRIWIKVSSDYENPVVKKEDHHRRYMLEHRYNIESFLSNHPELEITKKFLNDDGYLKSDYEVHHINLDYQDNRIDNLWIYESNKEHSNARESLYNLVDDLLEQGRIFFNDGKYDIKK